MTEFGGGIYLTDDFDLDVDETGDIRLVRGIDELEKDLALQCAIELQDVLGQPKTPETKVDIEGTIATVVEREVRVDAIQSISVDYKRADRDEAIVDVRVVTVEGNQDLVFSVSN